MVYLVITLLIVPSIIAGPETTCHPALPLCFLAVAAIVMAATFLRIIRAYGDAVLLAYEIGRMGILTRSPDDCEACKRIQEDVDKEVKKIRRKIPWWKLIVLAAPVAALAAACAGVGILTGPGIAACIAAALWLIGALLELAAEGEDVVEEKNELEEKKRRLEEHQSEAH